MMNLSTLFGSVHFTAFVLGAALYLGYLMLPYLKHILQPMAQMGQRGKIEDCDGALSKPTRKFTLRQAAFGGAVLSLLIALALSTGAVDQVSTSCPADMEDALGRFEVKTANDQVKMPQGTQEFVRTVGSSILATTLPSELLARASFVDRSDGSDELLEVLNSCAEWAPIADEEKSLVPASELQAQLSCIDQLVDSGTVQLQASPTLLSKSRNIMKDLRSRQDETTGASAEWARITHGIFQLSCNAVIGDITASAQKMKTAKGGALAAAVGPAVATLHTLKRLETPLKETLQALMSVGGQVVEQPVSGGNRTSEDLHVIQDAIGSDRTCAVRALQEGRSLAMVLPKNAPLVKKMMICRPRMLETFEDFVVRSAMQARDAATRFGLGLYFSDIGLAIGQSQTRAPFFGKGPVSRSWSSSSEVWAEDAEGLHAPEELVEAETLLSDGENATMDSEQQGERAAQRALRLYQHAKMLALKHHDGAAEWRYKAAAKIAASHQRSKLSAHALARLGYFLSLRGRKEEALEIIDESLKYGSDPLAQYLQASLRRSLGELKSSEDVIAAETQLSSVAGQLPSKLLEEQREAAHTQITWWRLVGTQGLQVCLKAWDAAQFLICVFAGLIFELPQAATTKAIAEDVQ